MPDEAATVFEKCINEKALVLSGKVGTHVRLEVVKFCQQA